MLYLDQRRGQGHKQDLRVHQYHRRGDGGPVQGLKITGEVEAQKGSAEEAQQQLPPGGGGVRIGVHHAGGRLPEVAGITPPPSTTSGPGRSPNSSSPHTAASTGSSRFAVVLKEELENDLAAFLVALDGQGAVAGYAGLQVVLDEGYIANIAVDPKWRRQGLAGELLEVYCRFAQAHLAFLTLEIS